MEIIDCHYMLYLLYDARPRKEFKIHQTDCFFSLLGPKLESVNKVETTEKVSPFSLFLINALVQMNLTAKVNSSQKQVSNI